LTAAQHRAGIGSGRAQRFDFDAIGAAQPTKPKAAASCLAYSNLDGSPKSIDALASTQGDRSADLLLPETVSGTVSPSGRTVPVDEPEIVARNVVAEVGELDTLPFAPAPPFAFHPAAKDFARDQLQPLQLGEQLGAEQRTSRKCWKPWVSPGQGRGYRGVTGFLRQFFQDLQQHVVGLDPFGLRLEIQDHTMPHRGQ
jgi:hypothetical protein